MDVYKFQSVRHLRMHTHGSHAIVYNYMHTLAIHSVLLLMSRENIFRTCSFRDENSHPINSFLSGSFYRRTQF